MKTEMIRREDVAQHRSQHMNSGSYKGITNLLKVALLLVFASAARAADVNVLIVGTTEDAGDDYSSFGTSKSFDITKVQAELQNILS